MPDEQAETAPLEGLLETERAGALRRAFARLSERCQRLLRMCMADPMPSYEEISAAMDMPVGAIGPTRRALPRPPARRRRAGRHRLRHEREHLMPPIEPPDSPEDDTRREALFDELRAAFGADPPPPNVVEGARAAFTWRRIDAELAELLADSALAEEPLAGVRGADEVRSLSFRAGDLALELDIEGDGERRRLIGQLAPAGPADVEVRHPGGVLSLRADELGRFAGDVPAGPISLRCRPDGEGAGVVETSWISI